MSVRKRNMGPVARATLKLSRWTRSASVGFVAASLLVATLAINAGLTMLLRVEEQEVATFPPEIAVTSAYHLKLQYDFMGYRLAAVRSGAREVPRLITDRLPDDLTDLPGSDLKKRMFIKTILPLILEVNRDIASRRARVLAIQQLMADGREIPAASQAWLAEQAAIYGTLPGDLDTLLRRLDVVPVSIALAQSAEESGWGTSRFAREGQALFGQHAYRASIPQMAPRNGADYRVRAFDDLLSSVATYIHNLNTHRAYREFRHRREDMRSAGQGLDPFALSDTLLRYSERGRDYIETIQSIMRQNDLTDFDEAQLDGAAAQPRFIRAS